MENPVLADDVHLLRQGLFQAFLQGHHVEQAAPFLHAHQEIHVAGIRIFATDDRTEYAHVGSAMPGGYGQQLLPAVAQTVQRSHGPASIWHLNRIVICSRVGRLGRGPDLRFMP